MLATAKPASAGRQAANAPMLVRFRVRTTSEAVARGTLRELAQHLDLNETQAIHFALARVHREKRGHLHPIQKGKSLTRVQPSQQARTTRDLHRGDRNHPLLLRFRARRTSEGVRRADIGELVQQLDMNDTRPSTLRWPKCIARDVVSEAGEKAMRAAEAPGFYADALAGFARHYVWDDVADRLAKRAGYERKHGIERRIPSMPP